MWQFFVSAFVTLSLTAGHVAPPALTITQKARAVKPGELVVLTIVSDVAISSLEAKAFDRAQSVLPLPPTTARPHAWLAFVGIDLEVRPGIHPVSISTTSAAGTSTTTHPLSVTAKVFATRQLKVNPDFVNPPKSEAARIARETEALNAAFEGTAGPTPLSELTFIRPVSHQANSAFGTRSIFNGEPRNSHSGADFLSPTGTQIKSPAAGKVVLADDLYFSGGAVVVDHGLGIVSLFAHMSKIVVKAGDDVPQGAVLGLVGATGRVTGAHLHWTVRVNGARVDPFSLLAILAPKQP